jgi:hypothetical protein
VGQFSTELEIASLQSGAKQDLLYRLQSLDTSMKTLGWPAVTYRVFAIGNVLVVLAGLLFLLPPVWGVLNGAVENAPTNSHFATWFWVMASINLCFLALLVVGSVRLFQLRPSGVTICNAVFVGELIYFLGIAFLWSALPRPVSMGLAAATGVGDMGLSPQLISGYPFVALICLNLARRKRTRTNETTPLPVS